MNDNDMIKDLKRYAMVFSYLKEIIHVNAITIVMSDYMEFIKESLNIFKSFPVSSEKYQRQVGYYKLNKEVFDNFIKFRIIKVVLL